MRGPIGFCLLGLVLFSGCGNSTSPTLEKVRPHLQSGAKQADFVQLLGNPTVDLGSDKEGNQHRLTYNLDGTARHVGRLDSFTVSALADVAPAGGMVGTLMFCWLSSGSGNLPVACPKHFKENSALFLHSASCFGVRELDRFPG
jgi:hypothetical protein